MTVVEVDANNKPSAQPLLLWQANGPVGQLNIGPLAPNKRYMVALTVYNGSFSHTATKYINTACTSTATPNPQQRATVLYPNPTTDEFTVQYGEAPKALPAVRDGQGQPVLIERTNSRYVDGQWHVTYRFLKAMPASLYLVETGQGTSRTIQSLSIQHP